MMSESQKTAVTLGPVALGSSMVKALRPHHWAKNILILLPLVGAHQITNVNLWWAMGLAFASFSLTASLVYIFNDLVDLPHDRLHPRKKHRPFASGALSARTGLVMGVALSLLILLLASGLPRLFTGLLLFYLAVNAMYSLRLKQMVFLDVIVLAGLYTLRVIAGGVATGIAVSHWMLAFTIFFFTGLAMAKRYVEVARTAPGKLVSGRGYHNEDKIAIFVLGSASSMMSLLVMILYLNSPDIDRLYQRKDFLWLEIPILLYWVFRFWILAHRDQIHDDPVVFALKDGATWATVGLFFLVLLFST